MFRSPTTYRVLFRARNFNFRNCDSIVVDINSTHVTTSHKFQRFIPTTDVERLHILALLGNDKKAQQPGIELTSRVQVD